MSESGSSESIHKSQQVLIAPLTEQTEDRQTFWALVGVLFQGAFSDNVYRLMLVMLVVTMANTEAGRLGLDAVAEATEANSRGARYQAIITILFMLPYVLGASLAGWLGDRFSKSSVAQWTKLMEIGVMGLATLTFAFGPVLFGESHPWIGSIVLFLMGLQTMLFSPSKYGIMPEILPLNRQGWGNGIMQGATFLAILLGTIAGPWLFEVLNDRLWVAGLILVGLAVVGWLSSMAMRPVPIADPAKPLNLNPFPMLIHHSKVIYKDVGLRWSALGSVIWWMVALMMQGGAVLVATNVLGLTPAQTGVALMPIVIAQGLGCFVASWFCRHRVELGLVPMGALGMFISGVCAWYGILDPNQLAALKNGAAKLPEWYYVLVPMLLAVIGFSMGFFIVPLEAFINQLADQKNRAATWATLNVLQSVGMIFGTALGMLITIFAGNPGDVFLVAGLLMLVTGVVICWRFPRIPLRFLVMCFLSAFYRVRVRGIENIPQQGGALLAPNHQSYLDGILIASLLDRPVRFVMSSQVYNIWFVYPFARITNTIPIEQNQSPRELIHALRMASDEIQSGGLICIFPEGQLTRNGQLMPFRRGVERIMKDIHAPIIPVGIDGAYDTSWALRNGQKSPSRNGSWTRRGTLSVAFGEPLPSTTPPAVMRQHVVDLLVEAFEARRDYANPLHREAIRNLRSKPFARAFSDHSREELFPNYLVLAAIAVLGKRLQPLWMDSKCVGILLPPSIGSLAVNLSSLLGGRVPVNLNYTTSPVVLEETCKTADIKLIITSRVFMEKVNIQLPPDRQVVYLEDVRAQVGKAERLYGMARALFMPVAAWERALGRTTPAQLDDLATLIFSSGSTGIPKGVMLSHWNIISNVLGLMQYVDPAPNTRILGMLPFFHSFGFTATLWLPLLRNYGVSYYPNPLDARAIGAVVEKYKVTMLLATPTFLAGYTRRVEPGQFGSLTFVLTGAEKLKESVSEGFRARFGIRPVEGFGCTECSPSVALNGFDYRAPGIFQTGVKHGTIGQAIPGMAARIVDLDTHEPVPPGTVGMLLVRGHGVMQGYYNDPQRTAEAFQDGWYRTGDVAVIDDDGFIQIRDRLARFSKIAGEMVPHIRIEEALQQAAGATEPAFAVTSVPCDKKGERLAVLYILPEPEARSACDALSHPDLNLPSLWIPRWNDFIKVDTIPILGSGKLDLKAVKATALTSLAS